VVLLHATPHETAIVVSISDANCIFFNFLMQTAFFLTAKEPEFQKAFFYCSVSFTFREYASKALGGNEPKSFESNYDFDTEVVQHFLAKQDST
jgi:hypothetical protein